MRKAGEVILVLLRQPGRGDSRTDPFYEFGSFGCTGCHGRNLMHPKRIEEVKGARLGFCQGGKEGVRLVLLTPTIQAVIHSHIVIHEQRCEARWDPSIKPFRYEKAPLIIDNEGESDFSFMQRLLKSTQCRTWCGRFSSRFRSRRAPLAPEHAEEVIEVCQRRVRSAEAGHFAQSYSETLVMDPAAIQHDRNVEYRNRLREARGEDHPTTLRSRGPGSRPCARMGKSKRAKNCGCSPRRRC